MRLTVSPGAGGERLDIWLARETGMSRARIQGLIDSGHVSAAGVALSRARKVTPGLELDVEIPPVQTTQLVAQDIPLDVMYEDSDIIVINKPAGLVVHPAAGHASGTLVNALLHHCQDLAGIGGELRPGIVHRLDKDTSGVMVVVKNEAAMAGVVKQFKEGRIHKQYVAIVHGIPVPYRGRLETLIGRSSHDRKKMSARPAEGTGRMSVTRYEVEEALGEFALMRVVIETGRTHQIRVHMAHLGHPVVGDSQYGGRRSRAHLPLEVARQMLHAQVLKFTHPVSGREVEFRSALPADMAGLLDALRRGSLG